MLIEGNALYRRAGEEITAGRGTVIVIPPETPHGFANTGAEPWSSSAYTSAAACSRRGWRE